MALVPPVAKQGFSYAGDSLYAEASNHNRHRRYTVPELKAHFKGAGDVKDPPAHWYEAQLIHYGLQPSKTKGTAHKRLFDAVNKGDLAVPASVKTIEADLKKEWTKKEREAKKVLKESAATPAKGTKRKAEPASESSTKKSKTTTVKTTIVKTTVVESSSSKKVAPKTTTKDAAKSAKSPAAPKAPKATIPARAPSSAAKPSTAARKPQTVARGGASLSGRVASSPATSSATPRTKQTARRGGSVARGKPAASKSYSQPPPGSLSAYDDAPPPYSEYAGASVGYEPDYNDYDDYDDDDDDDTDNVVGTDAERPPLGLLNGRYEMSCGNIEYRGGQNQDSGLVLTLDGQALWGSFDFGGLNGIFRLPQRPWQSSSTRMDFTWRGEDCFDVKYREDSMRGWIAFLGGGQVQGEIEWDSEWHPFDGSRTSGDQTRSDISAWAMRNDWERLGY